MLWREFGWVVHLIEAVAVIGALLTIGAVIAVSAFRLLARTVGMLAGASGDQEEPEDEIYGDVPEQSIADDNEPEWEKTKFRGGL